MKLILTTNDGLVIDQAEVSKAQLEEALEDEWSALMLVQMIAGVEN